MSNFDETMLKRLTRLEREVERLTVKESSGRWQTWTPTITFSGGSGTPSITAEGRQTKIGKIVLLLCRGYLTRNGASYNIMNFTLPVSGSFITNASFSHYFTDNIKPAGVFFEGGNSLKVETGAWTKDGYYWLSGFYEAA